MIEPIISLYKADISDHKAKIKELSGEQKKLAQEQLSHLEAQNKKLDGYIQTIGKAGLAIGAMALAGKLLWEGWEHGARKAQLSSNVSLDTVTKLSKGFGGLRTEMQTLETANKLSHSSLKLTGDQMEHVGRAIRQLVREGATWDDATQKVTESIVKLEGDALKDFGIRLREAKTDGEKLDAILAGLTDKSKQLGDQNLTSAESLVSVKTEFARAADSIKESLGKVAVALEPLIAGVAKLAAAAGGMLGSVAEGWGDLINLTRAASGGQGSDADKALFAKYGLKRDAQTGTLYYADAIDYYIDRGQSANITTSGLAYSPYVGRTGAVASSVSTEEWARLQKLGEEQKRKRETARARGGASKPTMPGYSLGATRYGGGYTTDYIDGWGGYTDIGAGLSDASMLTADWNARLASFDAGHRQSQSKLEKMFGPIEEFDAYRSAFEGLTGVVQGAFDAWITGSMSVGEAIKRMVGEVLRANAVQLLGEAIKHGVYAIGSLAFGDIRGAAQHGTAAAKAAAGAVALGALAKGLGAGASSGAGGGASTAAAPTSAGAGASGGGGNTYVVTYGDSFADDSPMMRQRNARKMIDSVMGSPGVR